MQGLKPTAERKLGSSGKEEPSVWADSAADPIATDMLQQNGCFLQNHVLLFAKRRENATRDCREKQMGRSRRAFVSRDNIVAVSRRILRSDAHLRAHMCISS